METTYKGYSIRIEQDTDPINPRTEWDNAGTMVCFYRLYNIGDVHMTFDQAKQFANVCAKRGGVVLPLFLYDHSGLAISNDSFVGRAQHAEWDSGQVGFIFIDPETIRKEFSVKRITKRVREKATKLLRSETETYDRYLKGDVYGYVIQKQGDNLEDPEVDSCWGFFDDPEYIIEKECKPIIDRLLQPSS